MENIVKKVVAGSPWGRNYVQLNCEVCGKTIQRRANDHARRLRAGRSRIICNGGCSAKLKATGQFYACAECGKKVWRSPSEVNRYDGKVFCTRKCSNKANNGLRTGRSHHGFKDGRATYRKRALAYYGEKCTVCGYAILDVLEVHHRDGNRGHNEIENLDVLCPTHHTEFEKGARVYDGMGSRLIGKATASGAVETGSNPVSPASFVM